MAPYELFQGVEGVVFGADVEDCLPFVVSKIEEVVGAVEVIHKVRLEHSHIVVLKSVVKREVAVIVNDVGPWSDLVDNGVLHVDAYNMLNSLSFKVLVTSRSKEFVVTYEPTENLLMSISCTLKQRILTKIVLALKSFKLIVSKDLEHLKVFALSSDEDGSLALEIGCQAAFRLQVVKSLDKLVITSPDGSMKRDITFDRILAEDIEVGEVLWLH